MRFGFDSASVRFAGYRCSRNWGLIPIARLPPNGANLGRWMGLASGSY